MAAGFLERESIIVNKRKRKLFLGLLLFYVAALVFIVCMTKGKVDFNDFETKKVVVILAALSICMIILVLFGFINSCMVSRKGECLILPFQENSKEAVGKIIDNEVEAGNVLVDEYTDIFSEDQEPHGERIMLLPSYLLLFNGMGKITAIPREKIYWLCAQVGRKGSSSFIVRIQIFTELKMFYLNGGDVEHLEEIAHKLYQYIPNVFKEYDPFALSYELEALYEQNRPAFLEFYQEKQQKM